MHLCPHCGFDLAALEPLEWGGIALTEREEIVYLDHPLRLPKSQYRIVEALVRARGRWLSRGALADRLGGEVNDSTIVKYVERVRNSFRTVDPGFDRLVAVRGFGAYRWAEQSAA